MAKFKEKATNRVWEVTNAEHLKHFRANPRFEEIKEVKKEVKENKKVEDTTKDKK